MTLIDYDSALVDDLASRFSLREPNMRGLRKAIMELSVQDQPEQVVLDMATGVGKTFLLAGLLEYAANQGVKNLLVVLPGKTVRRKTIGNFTPGATGFIRGAEIPKSIITPENFAASGAVLRDKNAVKLFLLNVHHLVQQDTDALVVPNSARSRNLRTARPQETLGGSLLDYLSSADDLLMILDESHTYSESAKTWEAALNRLNPAARVGLTATPAPTDNVIFRYSLRDAIADQHVKQPVVALRRGGYRDNEEVGRLKDAISLLAAKSREYRSVELLNPTWPRINPIMLVSCRDIAHAEQVASVLRRPDLLGSDGAVLLIHSESMTNELEEQLETVQDPNAEVRAIVQVDMLNAGWNVHNVAVLVPLRALSSGTLTEQMIGRGLRLPYGRYTGNEWVDTLDILSHESVNSALRTHGLAGKRELQTSPTDERSGTDRSPQPGSRFDLEGQRRGGGYHVSGLHNANSAVVPPAPDTLPLFPDDEVPDGTVLDAVAHLGGRARDLGTNVPEQTVPQDPIRVERMNASTFLFPASTIEVPQKRLLFSDLSSGWLTSVAHEVGDATSATIDREALVIAEDGSRVVLKPATQADVYDEPMSEEAVIDHLSRHLTRLKPVMNGPEGLENRKRSGPLARRFVAAASGVWTPKRAEAAARKLEAEMLREADRVARSALPVPKVHAVPLPKRKYIELPAGTKIVSHTEATKENFSVNQFYNDWNRGLYEASNFDAFATELKIARLLDTSGQIVWWTRLAVGDGAKIEYGLGKSYYPDFVAQDVDGVHWILEGKADKGADDQIVQDKRKAAVRVLREMEGLPEWQDSAWGYLIAYQQDVSAAESWMDLRSWSSPERMG